MNVTQECWEVNIYALETKKDNYSSNQYSQNSLKQFKSNSLDLSLFRKLGPYKVQINFEVDPENITEEIPPDTKPISGPDGISLAVVIIIEITVAFFGFIIIVILVVCIVMMKK
ncbi:MAG: hypothetical protein EZS28_016552 [Streblomastix strix]|uniref:Uncharacterized protein n=1 Tax=Streblomastix strix TaxID=222440 RepID=A0A5J4W0B6_9EUKA|nr:MAG: hypothetical protein EZS28_016552 [Streblomastix strix]